MRVSPASQGSALAWPPQVLRQFLRDFDDKVALEEPVDDGSSALGYPIALEADEGLSAASTDNLGAASAYSYAGSSYTRAAAITTDDFSISDGAEDAYAPSSATLSGLEFGGAEYGQGGPSYRRTHAAASEALSGWGDSEYDDDDLLETVHVRKPSAGGPSGSARAGRLESSSAMAPFGSAQRPASARASFGSASAVAPAASGTPRGRGGAQAAQQPGSARRTALSEAPPSAANARRPSSARGAGKHGSLLSSRSAHQLGRSPAGGYGGSPDFDEAGRFTIEEEEGSQYGGGGGGAREWSDEALARPSTAPASRLRPAVGSASGIPTLRSAALGTPSRLASSSAIIRRVDATPRRARQDPVSNYHKHITNWKGSGFLAHQSPHGRSGSSLSAAAVSPGTPPQTREGSRRRQAPPGQPLSFVVPTAKRRDDVVWETRLRMKAMRDGLHAASNGGPLAPRRQKAHARNTFVPPTEKRRDSLRWAVRADMAFAH